MEILRCVLRDHGTISECVSSIPTVQKALCRIFSIAHSRHLWIAHRQIESADKSGDLRFCFQTENMGPKEIEIKSATGMNDDSLSSSASSSACARRSQN